MSDFDPALQLTLQNEGGFFHNPVTGEIVNRGITLTFVRDCGYCTTADESFIQNLTMSQTHDIYLKYFWNAHNIGSIADQSLANKVFDLTVNMGPGGKDRPGALTLLQQAVNDCGGGCGVDGVLGPQSIAQINKTDAVQLLAAYRNRAGQRYRDIAAGNAKLTADLNGWLNRLNA